ncbi:nucleotidyltransferase family protein [Roseicyclus marinus]|uniref:nucleotidyltransferase family protein n=1 Tax=Roseicyclus marinus TaxID=2161673 RepID=UPI00240F9CB0|nr:nucleotidyltransferase family protein [Roseicyclus marinus]MDG3041230.1 nucleotidyltransferase family protein [Roseicyclus marinus]
MIRPDVMILAAGFGTRMGALTADRPKPLIEVAGRALLDHAIAAAREGGGRIAVNAHYRAAQIAAHLAGMPDIHLSVETPEILDSGGGVKRALPHLTGRPIATLNADAVWSGPGPIRTLAEAWDGARMGVLMLLVPRDRAVGRIGGGDVAMDAQGRLTWDRGAEGLVHTGAQLIDPALIAARSEAAFSLREIWQDQMEKGRLFGVMHPGRWADVGHPEGIALAEGMLADA